VEKEAIEINSQSEGQKVQVRVKPRTGNVLFAYELYSRLNQYLIDAFTIGVCFYAAYQLRFDWHVPPFEDYQMWFVLPWVMVGGVAINWLTGVYKRIWRYINLTDAIVVVRGVAIFSTLLWILRLLPATLVGIFRVPRSVILIEFVLVASASLSVRILRRALYEQQQHIRLGDSARSPIRALLVGAGSAGIRVVKEVAYRSDFRAVGFLDDDPKKVGLIVHGLPVLGSTESLAPVVHEFSVNQIIVCVANPSRALLRRVWALSDRFGVTVKTIPTLREILEGKANIAAFRDIQFEDLLGRESVELSALNPKTEAAFHGKRIMVVGAGGSIGSELVRQLLRFLPEKLILLDKDENGIYELCARLNLDIERQGTCPVVADIRQKARLAAVIKQFRPEVVFHAAAHKHVPLMELNPCEAVLNNVTGTRHLVDLAIEHGISRFILISTDKAVHPTSIMGATKRVCEMLVQASCGRYPDGPTSFASVRFGNVMGSRGSVVPLFQRQILRGGPVTITHPEVKRFLMTIPEAVSLLIRAGTLGRSGEIFILDMGNPVPILKVARELIELYGMCPGRDIAIKTTQLRPGEKLAELLVDPVTESLVSTLFESIFMVRGQTFDSANFFERLDALEAAAQTEHAEGVFQTLQHLHMGFKPAWPAVSAKEDETSVPNRPAAKLRSPQAG
jgi:FlaA1/EpsC-like NDP-sugar epimerase